MRELRLPNRSPVTALALSPDGERLVVGQHSVEVGANLTCWALGDLMPLADLDDSLPNETIFRARFSPRGDAVAYAATATPTRLYRVADASVATLPVRNRYVKWLDFAARRNRLVLSGEVTQVYDLDSGAMPWTLAAPVASGDPTTIPAVAGLDPAGEHVAVAGVQAGKLLVHDVASGHVVASFDAGFKHARWVQYSPDGRLVAAIDWFSNGIALWNAETGERLLPDLLNDGFEAAWSLAFDPATIRLAIGGWTGLVHVVRLATGEVEQGERVHEGRVWDMAFTPDGNELVTGAHDGLVRISEIPPTEGGSA